MPAGSVALADPYAGIYPTASPGGWRLVGRTDVSCSTPTATRRRCSTPGTRVRLRGRAMIEVVRPGLLTTVQDLGRPGYAHLGVPRSGALDAAALLRANRLVGNPDGAAGLETTLTGVALRAESAGDGGGHRRAGTGHRGRSAGRRSAPPVAVPAGALLDDRRGQAGVRSYLAFAGGITRRAGARQPLHRHPVRPRPAAAAGRLRAAARRRPAPPPSPRRRRVHAATAPPPARRCGCGSGSGRATTGSARPPGRPCAGGRYTLSVKSNRVGARLAGPPLTRAVTGELPSEGIVLGAVQVPADGQPLVFLADHPTTGGYPVIGVVDRGRPRRWWPRPAPVRPVRFVPWT